jgi:intraflagellar transport protein 122
VRQLDPGKPGEQRLLQQCAKQLQAAGQYQLAKEALMKLGDMSGLMALYVQHSKWEDALLMVHAHPECRCVAASRSCEPAACCQQLLAHATGYPRVDR